MVSQLVLDVQERKVSLSLGWMFLILSVLALGVRLFGIALRPLWYDEAFSVLFAEKGPQAMIAGTLGSVSGEGSGVASEEHPILYYTLLWGWMDVFGESPWSIRSISILPGVAVVLLVFSLLRELFTIRTAFVAAILVSLSPFQVHYSQEVRMYSLLALWLILATWSLWKGIYTKERRWWAIFCFSSTLAMYTHTLAVTYLAPLAVTSVFVHNREALKATVLSGLAAIILYIPWLIHLPAQVAKISGPYWLQPPSAARFVTSLLSYVTNLPLPASWLPFALFASFLCLTLATWQTYKAWRQQLPGVRRGIWLAYLSFAPPAFLLLMSQWKPVFVERALLPSGVIFLTWLSWAFLETGLLRPMKGLAFFLLLIGMGMGLYQHFTYQGFPYAPYKDLDRVLEEDVRSGDLIVHSNKLSMLPAVYYDRSLPQTYIRDPLGSGSDTLAPSTQKVLGYLAAESPDQAVGNARRVWFVIFNRAIDEYKTQGLTDHPQLTWLESHFHLVRVEEWNELQVYLFAH